MIAFKRLINPSYSTLFVQTQCSKYFEPQVCDTHIFLNNLCMTCIFANELVVTGGGICPRGGRYFSQTKNNYECPSRQNVDPTMMIAAQSNRKGILYTHFECSMTMKPLIGVLYLTF